MTLRFSIPFYGQASQFTCGPACLMMAMKFFQPTLNLNRALEFDIWREANLVESYGTSKEGLALAAARRGFDAYTVGRPMLHSFVDKIADMIPSIDNEVLELLYRDTQTKFRAMGLTNIRDPINPTMLENILKETHIPILLTSTLLFGGKEDLPHWIVLTGYSGDAWYINNPLGKSPNTQATRARLRNSLGFRGVHCAVVIRGLRKQRQRSKRRKES
jgi:hypothetical protein